MVCLSDLRSEHLSYLLHENSLQESTLGLENSLLYEGLAGNSSLKESQPVVACITRDNKQEKTMSRVGKEPLTPGPKEGFFESRPGKGSYFYPRVSCHRGRETRVSPRCMPQGKEYRHATQKNSRVLLRLTS